MCFTALSADIPAPLRRTVKGMQLFKRAHEKLEAELIGPALLVIPVGEYEWSEVIVGAVQNERGRGCLTWGKCLESGTCIHVQPA